MVFSAVQARTRAAGRREVSVRQHGTVGTNGACIATCTEFDAESFVIRERAAERARDSMCQSVLGTLGCGDGGIP